MAILKDVFPESIPPYLSQISFVAVALVAKLVKPESSVHQNPCSILYTGFDTMRICTEAVAGEQLRAEVPLRKIFES